ncbi:hemolysin family protein [Miltoncostaea oceani]|uniref:hemolysin family protein n=1 Tax=Miltoncostaea oceani TaxID=2843216 RepID=UPI001C3CF33C|nr:hemolysin family protein [Miltoncostaea oceani]
MTNTVQIVAALLLVLLNGFFVAAEFSLARARMTRLDQLAEQGRGSAVLAREQVRHIDRYLAACQLGITLASLGLGWLGEPAFAGVLEPFLTGAGLGESSATLTAVIIAFAIITVLHVVVGELAPKTVAIQRAEPTALSIARPLEWFRWVFSPFIFLLNGAGNALVRALGVEPASERELASTPEDLQILIAQSEEGGAIEPEEADMLEGVFGLQASLTRDIMTPRPEVTTLVADQPVLTALTQALGTRHSRFPVLNGDGVLGIVHLSQLARGLLESGEDTPVRGLVGPALFVPETQPVDDLLRQLQARRASVAVVLDEYGDFAGVVTVEDVIEEIVGEIDDERDRAPAVDQLPDGRLIVRGHVPIEDLADHGVELIDDTVTSVGGLVFTRLGRLPRTGDSVTADGWQLTVEATRGTRVVLVAIEPAEERDETPRESEPGPKDSADHSRRA